MKKISLYDYCKINNLEHILKEWDYAKNGDLKPTDVTSSSGKTVWWKCEKGHEWEAKVANRTKKESNSCPYCRNRRLLVGYNDLATVRPEIAKEWHPTKNRDLKPIDVFAGSGLRVWWQCEKGHEWDALISNRTKHKGTSCPYCFSKKIVTVGVNDLATNYPEIAKEWHPTKNGDLKPTDVTFGSSKKVWWQCEEGHEWEALVANRTKKNPNNCPYCANKKVLKGYNDLATNYPEIAKQWHPTKNGTLKPTQVTSRTSKIVWWQCEEGHEWYENISARTSKNDTSCPYCTGKYVII